MVGGGISLFTNGSFHQTLFFQYPRRELLWDLADWHLQLMPHRHAARWVQFKPLFLVPELLARVCFET